MRLCRFGDARLGLVEHAGVRNVTAALNVLPSYRYPLPARDVLIEHLDQVRRAGTRRSRRLRLRCRWRA